MTAHADVIASLVLKQFDGLPAKRKPAVRENGIHEWVPLSGIVAEGSDGKLQCLALATGMKCLPASKLSKAQGNVLHDWHAEILAIRAFNRFILDECKMLLAAGEGHGSSEFIRRRSEAERQAGTGEETWHGQPFAWREDVLLHMYCSEAPCGDASMELTMAAQDDASPWAVPEPDVAEGVDDEAATLPGRAYFSLLGAVRRKPARQDAPPTLSKSCSDKLSLKQCTSLLSSLTSYFVEPSNAYIHYLVLPESQHSATGCQRAFSAEGRMRRLTDRHWGGGYSFRPFKVTTTELEFAYSKHDVASKVGRVGGKPAASNLAVAWTRSEVEESSIGGVLQGRKQFDIRGASSTSRRAMWAISRENAALLGSEIIEIDQAMNAKNYGDLKLSEPATTRQRVKEDSKAEALKGWVKNAGDETFGL